MHRADVNYADAGGKTALHVAAANVGCEALVVALLKHGARVEAVNEAGATPLHWAALNGHTAAAQHLLAAGADVEARNLAGQSALKLATQAGHSEVGVLLADALNQAEAARGQPLPDGMVGPGSAALQAAAADAVSDAAASVDSLDLAEASVVDGDAPLDGAMSDDEAAP